MKGIRINRFFYFVLCIILLGVQSIGASESFQNNLLKVDVNENSLGEIKMTLYTNKPYNDSVVVNKKNDFEYVILLPETANSLTAKPSLNSTSNAVKDVNIKTQQYNNQVKGYTKITVLTTKPVQIIPQVQTFNNSDYQLSENDYNELIAQSMKNAITQTTSAPRSSKKSIQKQQWITPEPIRSTQKSKSKLIVKEYTKKQTPILVQKTIQSKKIEQKPIPVKKVETPATKMEIPTETIVTPEKTPEVTPEVMQTTAPTVVEPPSEERQTNTSVPVSSMPNTYKKIIKDNFYTILGLISSFLILLLLVVKKLNRNHVEQKNVFTNHLDEKPLSFTDYTKNINEDMSWKEKFQTYVDTVDAQPLNQSSIPPAETPLPSQELDELFIDESLLNNIEERDIEELFDENETFEIEEPLENFMQDELDDNILEEYEEEFNDEQLAIKEEPEIEEQDEFVKSEFVIDEEKGFYLVDFEDATSLVGHIEEEIFVLKRFDEKIKAPIQARLNEHKGNSVNYMTKIGNYRALVEVTPKDMNLLIEL